MKGRNGRTKQNAYIYLKDSPKDVLCSTKSCGKQSNHYCKLCNRSLCPNCFKRDKVEDVFVVSTGEHKICIECYNEQQYMKKLFSQYGLKFNTHSQFNIQQWLKDYNQKKPELSKQYSELKKKECHPCLELDIEFCHFNSTFHQFLIKTTTGESFIDMKIAIKSVVNAFIHLDKRINYKKDIVYQAFLLLNFTDEIGAFAMMKFLYEHIIPQQLYYEDKEFIRNLSTRILESLSQILKDNLQYMPIVKQILHDKLYSWIVSLFVFNFRFMISVYTLQQTFLHYSVNKNKHLIKFIFQLFQFFLNLKIRNLNNIYENIHLKNNFQKFESIVNTVIAIILQIYPHLKGVNYEEEKNRIDGLLFSDIFFTQFKQQATPSEAMEDYFKLISNKENLNNEIWGNDYQQTLLFYKEQNQQLQVEITNLTKECKQHQEHIEEIEKRVIDSQFESVIIPFEDNSSQKQKIEFLKQEQEDLLHQIQQKQESVNNLKATNNLIEEQKEYFNKEINLNIESIDEKAIEQKFIQEIQDLNKILEELENEKKQKKETLDLLAFDIKQVNLALDLMKQQEQQHL